MVSPSHAPDESEAPALRVSLDQVAPRVPVRERLEAQPRALRLALISVLDAWGGRLPSTTSAELRAVARRPDVLQRRERKELLGLSAGILEFYRRGVLAILRGVAGAVPAEQSGPYALVARVLAAAA